MSQIITNIVVLVGLAGLTFLGYFLYTQTQNTDMTSADRTVIDSVRFINQINTLRNIEMDTGLFAERDFQTLTSYSVPIVPVAVGNNNPL